MKEFDVYAGMASGEKAGAIERDRAALVHLLTDWDRRQCDREARAFKGRGLPNLYRLGHLLRAAEKAHSRVASCGWGWLPALRESFTEGRDGLFDLAPVRQFVRHLASKYPMPRPVVPPVAPASE